MLTKKPKKKPITKIDLKSVPPKAPIYKEKHDRNMIYLKNVQDSHADHTEEQMKIPIKNVGGRYQAEDKLSVIELPNGENLSVGLSMENLDRRFQDVTQDLDLCDVTGSNLHTTPAPTQSQAEPKIKSQPDTPTDQSGLKLAYEVGKMVDGKGIYLGIWQPNTSSIKEVFDLYAAPEDLVNRRGKRILASFAKASKKVTELKDWHGHDGSALSSADDVRNAIKEGRYDELEKWFIPNKNMLIDLLYLNRNKGALKGTFAKKGFLKNTRYCSNGFVFIGNEYSSGESEGSFLRLLRDFDNGKESFVDPDQSFLRTTKSYTRPVRAERRINGIPQKPTPPKARSGGLFDPAMITRM